MSYSARGLKPLCFVYRANACALNARITEISVIWTVGVYRSTVAVHAPFHLPEKCSCMSCCLTSIKSCVESWFVVVVVADDGGRRAGETSFFARRD